MIYTDRTRWETALQSCPRRRFLRYDLGGQRIQRTSPPMAASVGLLVHDYMKELLQYIREHHAESRISGGNVTIPRTFLRDLIIERRARWNAEAMEKGLLDTGDRQILNSSVANYIMTEQIHLSEVFAWTMRKYLPEIIGQDELVLIEEEVEVVLDCTLWLG